MFVPAEFAEMPVFDNVFIDVGDEQSLQQVAEHLQFASYDDPGHSEKRPPATASC